MRNESAIRGFWSEYLDSLPEQERDRTYFEAFSFGNTAESADHLAGLVMEGVKTATSELLWAREGQALWGSGDLSIVLDGRGNPVCVVRTTELRVVPFSEVDTGFVRDYGEGDRTLEWWRTEVWDHYREECSLLGRTPSQDMPLICERFVVVYPPSG